MNEADEPHYSLGAVVRLTGLSAHTLRAWERRYEAVKPARTAGGTRRYSAADVARLRLLRDAVEAGHRISELAPHDDDALVRLLGEGEREPSRPTPFVEQVCAAVDRLDPNEAERLLALQLSALGPVTFAREVASPVLREIGDRWASGRSSVASEHLLSSLTRNVLGIALRGHQPAASAPRVLFTTPSGERHELGTLIAAVAAVGAGANVTYLGPDLPAAEAAAAAASLGAAAIALGVVTLEPAAARRYLAELAERLPPGTEIWTGGPSPEPLAEGVPSLDLDELVCRIDGLQRARA